MDEANDSSSVVEKVRSEYSGDVESIVDTNFASRSRRECNTGLSSWKFEAFRKGDSGFVVTPGMGFWRYWDCQVKIRLFLGQCLSFCSG